MRKLLDYTLTGRWKTVVAEVAPESAANSSTRLNTEHSLADPANDVAMATLTDAQFAARVSSEIAAEAARAIAADVAAQAHAAYAARFHISQSLDSTVTQPIARPGSGAIRRLLDFTRTGHWRTIAANDLSVAFQATAPAPAPVAAVALSAAAEDFDIDQQFFDDTFFGVDVHEIPAEKWQEIAPLFPR